MRVQSQCCVWSPKGVHQSTLGEKAGQLAAMAFTHVTVS